MKNYIFFKEENSVIFSNIIKDKINKGFVIIEQNDKLPFAVLTKKATKVNHNTNLLISCVTLGLWSIPWVYKIFISSKERKILVAIDEDGNAFEEKCY